MTPRRRCPFLLPMVLIATTLVASVGHAATAPPPAGPGPERVVVIIGHNGGAPDPRPPLSFADDDAARLFLQLAPGASRTWLLTTFDRESQRTLPALSDIARPPTREQLAAVLGEAFWQVRQLKRQGKETEFIFAFAGHGDVDDAGRGFIVLADGPFTRDDLATQVLEASPADTNHVIVDACASYFFVKSRGGDGADGVDSTSAGVPLTADLLNILKAPGHNGELSAATKARTGLLVATSSASEVHESSTLSAGIFSYLLRSALTGVADVNGDGRLEYAETAAFVAQASAGLHDPRARLDLFVEPPLQRPNVALLDLRRSGVSHFLAIDQGPQHLRVLDATGTPYAEVHTDGKQPVYIALVDQPYYVVQREQTEALLIPREAGAYSLSALTFAESSHARGLTIDAAGLFERPIDPGFVAGFVASSQLPHPRATSTFTPIYAVAGEPPLHLPVGLIGGVTLGLALATGAAAGGAVVGNQAAFAALDQHFRQTGQLDPALALEVEGWRTAATGLTVGAVALGLAGGSLFLWSLTLDDGEVALP